MTRHSLVTASFVMAWALSPAWIAGVTCDANTASQKTQTLSQTTTQIDH